MTAPFQLAPGVVIGGDFRIQELLSAGGMGAVYVATQASTGKRRALKVMHPQLVADPRQRERFEQEARVGALIESSHVVEVIAAGVEQDSGAPWIAMELLDGQDLGAYAASHGCLSPDELLDVMRQLCHALGAAHTAGVVHRDIKPENVFMARSQTASAGLSIKVLDFGIAKVAAQSKTTATATVGSPAWMAPEQTDPCAPITPATDVWALGLMAFWLLTGRSFWLAVHDPHASMHALMREILFTEIPTASERASELDVRDRLVDGFDGWFARCVHRTPEKRYPTASAAMDAFEGMLRGERTVVHTSMPPSSSRSIAHGETLAMSSSGELPDVPVARVERTQDDVIHRRQATPTQPMPPPDHVNRTASPTVSDYAQTARDAGPRSRLGSRRSVGLLVAGLAGGALVVGIIGQLTPSGSATASFEPAPRVVPPKRDLLAAPTQLPGPEATPSASARPMPPAAKTQPRNPFDEKGATFKMKYTAESASRNCRNYQTPDPIAITVNVTWDPATGVGTVRVNETSNVAAAACVRSWFGSLTIPPYEPPTRSSSESVMVSP